MLMGQFRIVHAQDPSANCVFGGGSCSSDDSSGDYWFWRPFNPDYSGRGNRISTGNSAASFGRETKLAAYSAERFY